MTPVATSYFGHPAPGPLTGSEALLLRQGMSDTTATLAMLDVRWQTRSPQVVYASGFAIDGVTDDTAAWMALVAQIGALQTAGVGAADVVLPSGTSLCSQQLVFSLASFRLTLRSAGTTTIQFNNPGNGVIVSPTNGSDFQSSGLTINRSSNLPQSGTGFTLDADVSSALVKVISRLTVTGSWTNGIVTNSSTNFVLESPTVALRNPSTTLIAGTNGVLVGGTASGVVPGSLSSTAVINNPTVTGAHVGIQVLPTFSDCLINGGRVVFCNYGLSAYVSGSGSIQNIKCHSTFFSCTTRNIFLYGQVSDCYFFNNLHETYTVLNYPPASSTDSTRWIAIDFEVGPSLNGILGQLCVASPSVTSSFLRLFGSVSNRVSESIVQGCGTYAVYFDATSSNNTIAGISGTAGNGVTALLDPSSVSTGTEITDMNYNGQLSITPGLIIKGSNVQLVGQIFSTQFATDAAAGAAGLSTGMIYRDTSNNIKWKV